MHDFKSIQANHHGDDFKSDNSSFYGLSDIEIQDLTIDNQNNKGFKSVQSSFRDS